MLLLDCKQAQDKACLLLNLLPAASATPLFMWGYQKYEKKQRNSQRCDPAALIYSKPDSFVLHRGDHACVRVPGSGRSRAHAPLLQGTALIMELQKSRCAGIVDKRVTTISTGSVDAVRGFADRACFKATVSASQQTR